MRKTPERVKRGPGQDGLLVGLVLSVMIGWSTLADAPEELAEQIRANVERIAALVGRNLGINAASYIACVIWCYYDGAYSCRYWTLSFIEALA